MLRNPGKHGELFASQVAISVEVYQRFHFVKGHLMWGSSLILLWSLMILIRQSWSPLSNILMAIIVWVSTVVIIDPTDLPFPGQTCVWWIQVAVMLRPCGFNICGLKHVENKWIMFSGKSICKCLDFYRDTPPMLGNLHINHGIF